MPDCQLPISYIKIGNWRIAALTNESHRQQSRSHRLIGHSGTLGQSRSNCLEEGMVESSGPAMCSECIQEETEMRDIHGTRQTAVYFTATSVIRGCTLSVAVSFFLSFFVRWLWEKRLQNSQNRWVMVVESYNIKFCANVNQNPDDWAENIKTVILVITLWIRSSAVADRPRDTSPHWIFR